MSRISNLKSNIPTPPPLPPPLKPSSVEDPIRLKTKTSSGKNIPKRHPEGLNSSSRSPSGHGQPKIPKRQSEGSASNSGKRGGDNSRSPSVPLKPQSLNGTPKKQSKVATSNPSKRGGNSRTPSRPLQGSSKPRVISQDSLSSDHEDVSEVVFFDAEQCIDPEDQYSFPCCVPPYSPRYPPNPRPHQDWDPTFLPNGTNIPDSLGTLCRRCGKHVFLAELHLSSRGAYHTECYTCCLCGKSLDSWSVAEYKGEVFCKGCYRRNFGTHGAGFGVGAGVLQTP